MLICDDDVCCCCRDEGGAGRGAVQHDRAAQQRHLYAEHAARDADARARRPTARAAAAVAAQLRRHQGACFQPLFVFAVINDTLTCTGTFVLQSLHVLLTVHISRFQLVATGLRRLLLSADFMTSMIALPLSSDDQQTITMLADCIYHVLTAESYGGAFEYTHTYCVTYIKLPLAVVTESVAVYRQARAAAYRAWRRCS